MGRIAGSWVTVTGIISISKETQLALVDRTKSLTCQVPARVPATDGNSRAVDVGSDLGIGEHGEYQCLNILDIDSGFSIR